MNPQERHQKHVEITEALNKKNALGPCPVCGESERFPNDTLTSVPYGTPAPGGFVSCALVVCGNCGLVTAHSLQAIGVSKPADAKNEPLFSTQRVRVGE